MPAHVAGHDGGTSPPEMSAFLFAEAMAAASPRPHRREIAGRNWVRWARMRPWDVNPEQKLTRAGGGERKFLIAAAEIKSSRSCFTLILCSSRVYIYIFFSPFFF